MFLCCVALLISAGSCGGDGGKELRVFCGSAVKPPMDELINSFSTETGIGVVIVYGGSGSVLSQAQLSRSGDVYISGSPDFMETAKAKKLVFEESETKLAYLVPAIVVQKGNPKNIQTLEDLARPGVEVAIANPETVCLGTYAIEILEANGLTDRVLKNVKTYTESCSKTASVAAMRKVDAVIGWQVFGDWNKDLEVVDIKEGRIPRIAYAPAAVLKSSKKQGEAEQFIKYLSGENGRAIFEKYGYNTDADSALKKAPGAKFGGAYELPRRLRSGKK